MFTQNEKAILAEMRHMSADRRLLLVGTMMAEFLLESGINQSEWQQTLTRHNDSEIKVCVVAALGGQAKKLFEMAGKLGESEGAICAQGEGEQEATAVTRAVHAGVLKNRLSDGQPFGE